MISDKQSSADLESRMAANQHRSLFKEIRPKAQLHPSFKLVASSPRNKSTRQLLTAAFGRFVDRDGNFVEQFQSFGFDNRTFELFVSELLHEEGFKIVGDNAQPDFIVEKDGVQLSIECSTTNRTDKGDGRIQPYEPTNELDSDIAGIRDRSDNEIPIRLGGALRNKMLHRLDKKRDPKAYWELPHVSGKPFILAIQAFHEHGSLGFSSAPVARYLYGIQQSPSWDAHGNLVITTQGVVDHSYLDKKNIKSGFFGLPHSENVSAVLWTNAGTIAKFTRMALAGEFPDPDVTMLRLGSMYDFGPNATTPLPFAYIVGDEDAPMETWGQEAVLLHNPSAKYPVPRGLFSGVAETVMENGAPVDYLKGDFNPYMSMSHVFGGPGHRRGAISYADHAFEVLRDMLARGTTAMRSGAE
jgi:hypothetical protein